MQKDKPRKSGVRVRVGSLTVVVGGNEEATEDDSNQVSIVQRNPLIINGVRVRRSAGPKSGAEEWI